MTNTNQQITIFIEHLKDLSKDSAMLGVTVLIEDEDEKRPHIAQELFWLAEEFAARAHILNRSAKLEDKSNVVSIEDQFVEVFAEEPEEADDTGWSAARDGVETMIANDPRTITQFADDAGLTPETIRRFLNGEGTPRTKTLRGLERALGLDEGALDESR